MAMMIETNKPGADAVADARRILLVHRAASGGLCDGCYEFACAISVFPCSQARWAQKVIASIAEGGQS